MFGHAKAIASLKELNKPRVTHFPPPEHVRHLNSESDRSFIILNGSMMDDQLQARLEKEFSGFNADERARFFRFEGPGGSFSNRIKLAQGLNFIDRATARLVDLVREMRNAAAHSHSPMTFDTPAVRCGVMAFFKSDQVKVMRSWNQEFMRFVFGLSCSLLCSKIVQDDERMTLDDAFNLTLGFVAQQDTSPGK